MRVVNLPSKCDANELRFLFRPFYAEDVEVENSKGKGKGKGNAKGASGYVSFQTKKDMDNAFEDPPVRVPRCMHTHVSIDRAATCM